MNNYEFRKTYAKVKPDEINAQLDKYQDMPPFHQIRALHLLHIMGIMSTTLRLEGYKTEENKVPINSAINKGLISLYVMNHLAGQDMDKSDYYQEHRLQIVYTCILSHLSDEYQDEALLNMEHGGLKPFVHNTRMKSEVIREQQKIDQQVGGFKFLEHYNSDDYEEEQLALVMEQWAKKSSKEGIQFNVDMAIAKEYATEYINQAIHLDVDFKVDDTKLQDIAQKYDFVIPKFMEQLEKKEA